MPWHFFTLIHSDYQKKEKNFKIKIFYNIYLNKNITDQLHV